MMMCYQQQAELALLEQEARLKEAAEARRFAHYRQQRPLPLWTWLHRLWGQQQGGFSQPQPVRKDRIAAMRHQTG